MCFTKEYMAPVVESVAVPTLSCLRLLSCSCCISSPFLESWEKCLGSPCLPGKDWKHEGCGLCFWAGGHNVGPCLCTQARNSFWEPLVCLSSGSSHSSASACLCLYTQPAETGYFCFPCLGKSTRYILGDPRLRFARKNHGLKNSIFYFSIRKKAFPKTSRRDLQHAKCYVREVLQSLDLHFCWDSSAAQAGVFVNRTETALWTTAGCWFSGAEKRLQKS